MNSIDFTFHLCRYEFRTSDREIIETRWSRTAAPSRNRQILGSANELAATGLLQPQ
ncbi:MAG TPA: hypothetical protein V6C90_25700 [Coleofasciculaceae cyanobacterium]